MKLLFDENLSYRLAGRLHILYPESSYVEAHSLGNTDDAIIWNFAKRNDFIIVSKDEDFYQRSLMYGPPPKLIYLRVGNCPTDRVFQLFRLNHDLIAAFIDDEVAAVLVLA